MSRSAPLGDLIRPSGPPVDESAAARLLDQLAGFAAEQGWRETLDYAWPTLGPMFSAAPYLAFLARTRPDGLRQTLISPPAHRLAELIGRVATLERVGDLNAVGRSLRRLKRDLHLLIAIADVGGAWRLGEVTSALSDFADAVVDVAFRHACRMALGRGGMPENGLSIVPRGLFVVAMGKYGAKELNYSSDIDLCIFYDGAGAERFFSDGLQADFCSLFLSNIDKLIHRRTPEGYVFRIDYRLRPDPSATPVIVTTSHALNYYEARGQNWERAAYIKARSVAGDDEAATRFLNGLAPFIWRKNLDFRAVSDIHSIKRQIHIHKADINLEPSGADLKLGTGGIREIEFFVQVQQLILGGRDPSLRVASTGGALEALGKSGFLDPSVGQALSFHYGNLRKWEHRCQMIGDEQTHRLPRERGERRRIASLAGHASLRDFDAEVRRTLRYVHSRFGELFAEEEALSAPFGNLVFTGVDDDPRTLATLARLGFKDGARVSETLRAWHGGGVPATASASGREVLTRLTPRLLQAARSTGSPDAAFWGFSRFVGDLAAGAQIQSLLLTRPEILRLLLRILASAPRVARLLSRQPAALDTLVGGTAELDAILAHEATRPVTPGETLEVGMDAARRLYRERALHIAILTVSGELTGARTGLAFSDLADAIIQGLAASTWSAVERSIGAFPGEVAVIAFGKVGSREMTAASDLDLMSLYWARSPDGRSALNNWPAETVFARFTQRLVTALSAPTNEGNLYNVDMRLRPSGRAGPVAVSLAALQSYYEREAETWELLALTRARVVWATSAEFHLRAEGTIEQILREPRERSKVARDVAAMRRLLRQERPPSGFWDIKLVEGGLVDIEFVAQFLQVTHAANGGPLPRNTAETLSAFWNADPALRRLLDRLAAAWTLQHDLAQLIRVALEQQDDPDRQPPGFGRLLAQRGGARTLEGLRRKIAAARTHAHTAFDAILGVG